MSTDRISRLTFATVYPLYIAKVERKGRTRAEVDTVIRWLTGYSDQGIAEQIAAGSTFAAFFAAAPALNPAAAKITGKICGHRVEETEDPLAQKVRWLDKLVDELAKGRKMEKILRE